MRRKEARWQTGKGCRTCSRGVYRVYPKIIPCPDKGSPLCRVIQFQMHEFLECGFPSSLIHAAKKGKGIWVQIRRNP